jgi:catalase
MARTLHATPSGLRIAIRDAIKFPDFIHTQKRDPQTNAKRDFAQWDFWSQVPEALHQVTILFSDRGIPKGIQCMPPEEADRLAAENPDYHTVQLFEAIKRGEYPKWTFYVQVMPEEEAEHYRWNPFDLTKVWPHGDYPLIEVGVMELNRNPANYFAEVEQSAFSPANVVPGISFSPCKMLQARIFSYADAHRYRLGVNYERLPINCPHTTKVQNTYQRDGAMRFDDNGGGDPNYEPNTMGGPVADPKYVEPPLKISGDADRYEQKRGVDDDYVQPGNLFRLLGAEHQARLCKNIAGSLGKVPKDLQEKMVIHFTKADPEYGDGVAKALGLV